MVRAILITDRRLCGGDALLHRLRDLLSAAPPGSFAVQVREKDLDGAELLAMTRAIVAVARPLGAEVWVNDRADIALAADADGVHVPERGLSITDARAIAADLGRTLRVGCSRHTSAGVLAAAREGAERIHLGPIWSTPGKQPIGVDALAVRRELPAHVQLVAVGGIDGPERAAAAHLAGADAVAVIRAAWLPDVTDGVGHQFSWLTARSGAT